MTSPARSTGCGADSRRETGDCRLELGRRRRAKTAPELLAVLEVTTPLAPTSESLRSLSLRGPVSFPDGPQSKRAPGTIGETMLGSEISTTPHPPPEGARWPCAGGFEDVTDDARRGNLALHAATKPWPHEESLLVER